MISYQNNYYRHIEYNIIEECKIDGMKTGIKALLNKNLLIHPLTKIELLKHEMKYYITPSLKINYVFKPTKDYITQISIHDKGQHLFPYSLFLFRNLEKLSIVGLDFKGNLPIKPLSYFKKLKVVELSGPYKILFIYRFLEKVSLSSLTINHCNLTTLPTSIENQTKFNYLNLAYNKISQLPKEIKYLKNLRTLDLSNNLLNHFPKSLERMKKLESLNLKDNNLSKIPRMD